MPNQRRTPRTRKSQPAKRKAQSDAVILRPTHVLAAARFPSNQTFMLRYCPQVVMNPSSLGICSLYQFRANDLYDPDFTSTGGQPRGFDQIMAYYNHFTVVHSRMRVHVSTPTLTSTGNQYVAVCLTGASGDVSSTTTLTDILETIPDTNRDWGMVGTANNGRSVMYDSKWITFDAKRFFGKNLDVLYSDFQGSASGSPAELAFFNIFVGAYDRTSDTDAVQVVVELEYTARFSEPKLLPSS